MRRLGRWLRPAAGFRGRDWGRLAFVVVIVVGVWLLAWVCECTLCLFFVFFVFHHFFAPETERHKDQTHRPLHAEADKDLQIHCGDTKKKKT